MDYCDNKPFLNSELFLLLVSSTSLRQVSRNLGLTLRCVELKARKIGRHLDRLLSNLQGSLPAGTVLQFDEFESYESRRNTRPLTMPTVIERESRYILAARSAPIRPSGAMTKERKEAIRRESLQWGQRPNRSRAATRSALKQGARSFERGARIVIETDEKTTYPSLIAQAFQGRVIEHRRTNSRICRDTTNPLFPINHTEAMFRHHLTRLIRGSWWTSKKRVCLNLALPMFLCYRNFVRRRFNNDRMTPAQRLGWLPRQVEVEELLTWRQDWGLDSIHILATRESEQESWPLRGASA